MGKLLSSAIGMLQRRPFCSLLGLAWFLHISCIGLGVPSLIERNNEFQKLQNELQTWSNIFLEYLSADSANFKSIMGSGKRAHCSTETVNIRDDMMTRFLASDTHQDDSALPALFNEEHAGLELFHQHERDVLSRIVSNYMTVSPATLYKPELNISSAHPYVFFHQRKSGGTTLRADLEQAAKKLNLPYFIPCHGGVPCDIYNIPDEKLFALYGMHGCLGFAEGIA